MPAFVLLHLSHVFLLDSAGEALELRVDLLHAEAVTNLRHDLPLAPLAGNNFRPTPMGIHRSIP